MGLEGVELIMDVEDTFDIKIEDEEATACSTIGDLHQCIIKKFNCDSKTNTCLTQKTFYTIKKILVNDFVVPEKSVVPSTETGKLPIINMRKFWKYLEQEMQFNLPKLELSSALVLFYCIMCFIISSLTAVKFGLGPVSVLGSFVFWIVFFYKIVRWLSKPFAVVVPSSCKSLGDLARITAVREYQKKGGLLSDDDIWSILIKIVSDNTGEDKNTLEPETRFVEDLNFG